MNIEFHKQMREMSETTKEVQEAWSAIPVIGVIGSGVFLKQTYFKGALKIPAAVENWKVQASQL